MHAGASPQTGLVRRLLLQKTSLALSGCDALTIHEPLTLGRSLLECPSRCGAPNEPTFNTISVLDRLRA
jgi:hypothetical protein